MKEELLKLMKFLGHMLSVFVVPPALASCDMCCALREISEGGLGLGTLCCGPTCLYFF